jgi:hypothetical protein
MVAVGVTEWSTELGWGESDLCSGRIMGEPAYQPLALVCQNRSQNTETAEIWAAAPEHLKSQFDMLHGPGVQHLISDASIISIW